MALSARSGCCALVGGFLLVRHLKIRIDPFGNFLRIDRLDFAKEDIVGMGHDFPNKRRPFLRDVKTHTPPDGGFNLICK